MQQQRAAAGQEALDPPGRVRRAAGGGEHQAEPPPGLRRVQPAVVQQQPDGPPAQQPGHAGGRSAGGLAPGERAQRAGPAVGEAVVAAQQADRAVHLVEVDAHRGGAGRVQAGAGGRQADPDPVGEPAGHLAQGGVVGAPDVAVAQRADQGGQGAGQVGDIGVQCGEVGEHPHHGGQRLGQVGHQAGLHQPGELGEFGRRPGGADGLADGGPLDRGAPLGGLGDPDRELGLPAQPPALPEGAGGGDLGADRHTPVDAQQPQPVQQPGAGRVGLLAQVEVELARLGRGLEPQGALEPGQVALERDGGRVLGHRAERVADHQPVPDQREGDVRALAHHRAHGVQRLGEPGQRAAAQPGEGAGQPDRLDDVRGGDRVVLGAEQAGGPGEPAGQRVAVRPVQVVVPARGDDPGAVAGQLGEPAVRPGHPGDLGPHLLRQPGEQRPVLGDGRRPLQRGHVEGPADHRDPVVAGPAGGADPAAHVRLALPVAQARPAVLAQHRHRLGDGRERRERVLAVGGAAVLDDVLPPALGVVVAGRLGEPGDRVARQGGVLLLGAAVPALREGVPGRQVDEPERHPAVDGVTDRHPLRRELGVGPERGPGRVVGRVGQQGDRRHHVLRGGQPEDRLGLRRPLHQHRVRPQPLQRGRHRAGRARPVVPYAQQCHLCAHRALPPVVGESCGRAFARCRGRAAQRAFSRAAR